MHELSLCQALLDQVTNIAKDHQAPRVCHIRIRNGPLSGVDSHLLEQAFLIARLGTVAEEAQLTIEPEILYVKCKMCGQKSTPPPNHLTCINCGDWRTEIVSGDALLLLSVELEI